MAIRTTYKYKCDLDKGTLETSLRNSLMQADALADAFAVTVQRNGADVDISGMAVFGYLYANATKTTVPLKGTVSGSTATVILSEDCYAVPGYASLMIQLHDGDVRHTVLKVDFVVTRTGGTLVLDGDNILPTLAELLGQISAMEQATAEAREAAENVEAFKNEIQGDITALTQDVGQLTQDVGQLTQDIGQLTQDIMTASAPAITPTAKGSIVSIADGAERTAVSLVSHIEPVQEGSGDPSLDNVRPISGWDSATAKRTGKNLLPAKMQGGDSNGWQGVTVSVVDGKFHASGTATASGGRIYIRTEPFYMKTGKYCLSVSGDSSMFPVPVIQNAANNAVIAQTGTNTVFEIAEDMTVFCGFTIASGGVYSGYFYPQIEAGSTATDYEPYQDHTLTASLPEMVYGGKLDWLTGVLTVDRGIIKMSDIVWISYTAWGSDHTFYAHGFTQANFGGDNAVKVVAEAYAAKSQSEILAGSADGYYIRGDTAVLYVSDARYTDYESFRAGVTGYMVYPLVTPYTIQLTTQQLETLKGTNNVWSDTGNTELTYIADTKLYIDKKFDALNAALLSTGANV